jgi:hypothetical protein
LIFLVSVTFVVIITPMPVALWPVSPLFVCLVLIMPMLLVAVVMAVADEFLTRRGSAEMIVVPTMLVKMKIGLWFVNYYFPAMVEVKIIIAGRQFMREGPVTAVEINELMVGHVVICLNVRNVIIFYVIVPSRSPGWLNTNVYRKIDLCACRIQEGRCCQDSSCK